MGLILVFSDIKREGVCVNLYSGGGGVYGLVPSSGLLIVLELSTPEEV